MWITGGRRNSQGEDADQRMGRTWSGTARRAGGNVAGAEGRRGGQELRGRGNGVGSCRALQVRSSDPTARGWETQGAGCAAEEFWGPTGLGRRLLATFVPEAL